MNEQVQNMLFGTDNHVMGGFIDVVQSLLNCSQTHQADRNLKSYF